MQKDKKNKDVTQLSRKEQNQPESTLTTSSLSASFVSDASLSLSVVSPSNVHSTYLRN